MLFINIMNQKTPKTHTYQTRKNIQIQTLNYWVKTENQSDGHETKEENINILGSFVFQD